MFTSTQQFWLNRSRVPSPTAPSSIVVMELPMFSAYMASSDLLHQQRNCLGARHAQLAPTQKSEVAHLKMVFLASRSCRSDILALMQQIESDKRGPSLENNRWNSSKWHHHAYRSPTFSMDRFLLAMSTVVRRAKRTKRPSTTTPMKIGMIGLSPPTRCYGNLLVCRKNGFNGASYFPRGRHSASVSPRSSLPAAMQ